MTDNHISDEDDYMSDSFLNVNVNVDKCKPAKLLRQIEIDKKRMIANLLNKQKSMTKQNIVTETAFNKKIDSSNIGFKMLLRMGYKEGDGLGIDASGIKEPVTIKIKQNREGLGLEKQKSNELQNKLKRFKQVNIQVSKDVFLNKVKTDKNYQQLTRDIKSARKTCQHLDENNKIESPALNFWPLNANEDKNRDIFTEMSQENLICEPHLTEEFLNEILEYLRTTHFYCIYCGTSFNDIDDMQNNCPGKFYDQH